jgi:hypothetical protein
MCGKEAQKGERRSEVGPMSAVGPNKCPAPDLDEETTRMPKRLATFIALMMGCLLLIGSLPAASASAAEPWWQVLTGSRPTNLWEPVDATETQEVTGQSFFGLVFAAEVVVAGETVGCLGSGSLAPLGGPSANQICEEQTGHGASETAAEFKTMLEGPYGSGNVEVSGGPAGSTPFLIETPWGPPIELHVLSAEVFGSVVQLGGELSSKAVSEGSGRLVITLTNLGDAAVDTSSGAVTIVDKLPPGTVAYGVEAGTPQFGQIGTANCRVEAGNEVVCTYEGTVPPYEAIEVEVLTALPGSPPVAGAPGEVSVSGGNAKPATAMQQIKVSAEPVPFGIEQFSAVAEEEGGEPATPGLGGAPATQAGSHPFQFTTTLQLNAGRAHRSPPPEGVGSRPVTVEQPALPRNVRFSLPAGLIGNASAVPQCKMRDFLHLVEGFNECPATTAVGVSSATVVEEAFFGLRRLAVPVFNLAPAHGEPARFGFMVAQDPVVIDTSVDPNNRYRIFATVSNVTQLARFLSATTVLWGTPGDPRHDNARGWNCFTPAPPGAEPCKRPPDLSETAFLRMPVQCSSPLNFGLELEPWNVPLGSVVADKSFTSEPLQGCNQLPFTPEVSAAPTSKQAESSSGLKFQLDMPNKGLFTKEATAEGQAKKVEVSLPEGMTINPSQAEGLGACSPAQYAQERFDSAPGEGCPESSKIGSVDITTPLLDEEAHGSVYVAAPYDNPFDSLLALYMVAKIPERGILVKQAGEVRLDPNTGQITTTFDDLPQIPFETFKLNFFGGDRAPLVMPSQCGSYDIVTRFTPWHAADPNNPAPEEVITKTTPFTIDQGCPSGPPSFKPGFVAGTENNAAGSYSPFTARLTRNDGEQEFSRFSMRLPKGVIGKLAGIPFCSNAAIAAARARTGPNGGQEELDHPSCPDASQIGRTLVGAGVGPSLTYVPGKIYLAGPYQGSKLSIVAITTGKAGPFDLGTVVIRQALRVDPETADVSTDGSNSDPIPHILQGIVTHARDIRIYVDRKNFVLNPTSCARMKAEATVIGSGADLGTAGDDQAVDVKSPFQAADCASLGFKPKLALTLSGGTKRADTPRLRAVLKARKGDANIGRAQVTLPPSAFLEQAHIRTVCTRVQFKAGAGNGAQCPKASIYGHAKAISPLLDEPLKGPVFLRSSDNELPDLVAALHSSKVDIDLVGRIDSLDGRIRTTFGSVPDAPVKKFILAMQGGKKGLIVNSTNICSGKQRAIADFRGQNGRRHLIRPIVKAKCKKSAAEKSR